MAIISVNLNTFEAGEEYLNKLSAETNRNFKLFLALLSSYWQSSIDGPNYTREIKSIAIALSELKLSLESIQADIYHQTTRTEFLYQVITSILFPGSEGAPDLEKTDVDFKEFLIKIINIYFAGSIPESIKQATELLTKGEVKVTQNFLEARKPGSGFDISDQFGFVVDIVLSSLADVNIFLAEKNIRLVFDIIRPAHTLYRLKFILKDKYDVVIKDSLSMALSDYKYEDFRKFVEGIDHIDPLGTKKLKLVTSESHDADF